MNLSLSPNERLVISVALSSPLMSKPEAVVQSGKAKVEVSPDGDALRVIAPEHAGESVVMVRSWTEQGGNRVKVHEEKINVTVVGAPGQTAQPGTGGVIGTNPDLGLRIPLQPAQPRSTAPEGKSGQGSKPTQPSRGAEGKGGLSSPAAAPQQPADASPESPAADGSSSTPPAPGA